MTHRVLSVCFLLQCFALLNCAPTRAEETAGIEIYNFSQLIDKAERIVLGEIGERKDGRVPIASLEILKAPANDPQKIAPDAYTLAEERLKNANP